MAVCIPCGNKFGSRKGAGAAITCWIGKCECCGEDDIHVTSSRHYGEIIVPTLVDVLKGRDPKQAVADGGSNGTT